jgi:hypothetical protein
MVTGRRSVAAAAESDLVVAVTGPTGTFGYGLLPLLQADPRIAHVVGIARRPFDPAAHGWDKMEYRQGDVRDPAGLEQPFRGADVVVHLAFLITGTAGRATIRAVNVEGTLNAVRAAAAAGARRFVYASSVAAYGFHADNPVGMTEDWPVRPAARLFYAQEKAELERLLGEEAARHPGSTSISCAPRSCSARMPSAPRTSCPDRSRRSGAGSPAVWAGCPYACRRRSPSCRCSSSTRTTSAGPPAVHRRRRPAWRLQHRWRRRAVGDRGRARARSRTRADAGRLLRAPDRAVAALAAVPFIPPAAA